MLGRLPVHADPAAGFGADACDQGDADTADTSCGSACDGLPRYYEFPVDDESPAVGHAEAEQIRRSVAIAYRGHVTSRGTEPGDAQRWAEQILESVVPWQQVLAAAVRRCVAAVAGSADYTYARPSRRRAAVPKVVLPGMRRPLPSVAVVVDTSSSVDDGLLAQALAEVEGALRGLGVAGGRMQVLSCDAHVHAVSTVSRASQVQLYGGGGTDMRVGIDAALALRPAPEVVVVLSDGYTPWPAAPPPGVAMVVGLLGRDRSELPETPPWMVRVECVMPA
jgi:predicted metal-dependent peptidase